MRCDIDLGNGTNSELFARLQDTNTLKDATIAYNNSKKSFGAMNKQGERVPKVLSTNPYEYGTLDMLKGILEEIGVEFRINKDLPLGVEGVADVVRQIVETKEEDKLVLAEETSHILLSLLPTSSKLYQSMFKAIEKYPEYKEVKEKYEGVYTTEQQKKEEAIAKVLRDVLVDEFEGNIIKRNQLKSWWRRLVQEVRKLFTGIDPAPFQQFAELVASRRYRKEFGELSDILSRSKSYKFEDGVVRMDGMKVGTYVVEDSVLQVFVPNQHFEAALVAGLRDTGASTDMPIYKELVDKGIAVRTIKGFQLMPRRYSLEETSVKDLGTGLDKIFKFKPYYSLNDITVKGIKEAKSKATAEGWRFNDSLYATEGELDKAVKEWMESENKYQEKFANDTKTLIAFGTESDEMVKKDEYDRLKQKRTILRSGMRGSAEVSVKVEEFHGYEVVIIKDGDSYNIVVPMYKADIFKADNFMSKLIGSTASRRGYSLPDNGQGRASLIGGAVAATILQDNPNAKINSVKYVSRREVAEIDIYDAMDNLKLLHKHKYLNLPIDPKYFDRKLYRRDFINLLVNYYTELAEGAPAYMKPIKDYSVSQLHEAIERRLEHMHRIAKPSGRGSTVSFKNFTNPQDAQNEYWFLVKARNQLYQQERGYNLDSIKTSDLTFSTSAIYSQLDYTTPELNEAFYTIRKYMDIVKLEFQKKYREAKMKLFNDYLKGKLNLYEKGTNVNEKVYRNLFEDSVELPLYKNGNQVFSNGVPVTKKARTLVLKDPNELKGEDKEFVESLLKLIKEAVVDSIAKRMKNGSLKAEDYIGTAYKDMKPEEVWYELNFKGKERFLPPIRGKALEAFRRGDVKAAYESYVDLHLNFEVLNNKEHLSEMKTNSLGILGSFSGASYNYGSMARLKALGMDIIDDKVVLVSETQNNSVTGDLQVMADFFVMTIKKEKYNREFTNAYYAANVQLMRRGLEQHGDENKLSRELSHLSDVFNSMVNNEVEDAIIKVGQLNLEASATKLLTVLNKASDATKLLGNIPGMAGAIVDDFRRTLANGLVGRYDTMFFPTMKEMRKAAAWIGKNPKTAFDIMDMMLFHNMDETDFIYAERLKAGQDNFYNGVLTGRYAVAGYGIGTYVSKSIILIGKMMKDGILDNWSRDSDNALFYDWSKDTRSKALQDTIKENLRMFPKKDNEPIWPYDQNIMNSLRTMATQLYGSVDDYSKSKASVNLFYRSFYKYKDHLRAAANSAFRGRVDNPNIIMYDKDANTYVMQQEGTIISIVQLMTDLMHELKENKFNFARTAKNAFGKDSDYIDDVKRKNLMLALFDLLVFTIAFVGTTKLIYDDEDEKPNRYLYYSIFDIINMYNPVEYARAITTPVAILMVQQYGQFVLDIFTGNGSPAKALNLIPGNRVIDMGAGAFGYKDFADVFE